MNPETVLLRSFQREMSLLPTFELKYRQLLTRMKSYRGGGQCQEVPAPAESS